MEPITRHLIDRGDGASVELFQAHPAGAVPCGAVLFVHGNQGGRLIGAKEIAEKGALTRFASGLNITAAAVSQPGFGSSCGPADFCGPITQKAIIAALNFLKKQPSVDPAQLVLYGHSRGAIAAAIVATQVFDLRAVILSSGVYDLKEVYHQSSRGIRRAIEIEAGLSEEAFLARSARFHADKIRAETLLLHGRYDDRAPLSQAEAMSDALIEAGSNAMLKIFDSGHELPRKEVQAALRPFLQDVFLKEPTVH
ncbi:S9 family peptidase [Labrenzia sp. PHM005]|uniref:alpha/beta hydrolase family protein n=1 Tax=Labrenzia sp. PHM005 TaxID=2590016 RepID=UPI00114015E8|nr:alpha/beta fold hydrolase [Labrenzia sp. PHM005]QDG77579.1 S9 family peptidase [Labrenzia sp. PHM005]